MSKVWKYSLVSVLAIAAIIPFLVGIYLKNAPLVIHQQGITFKLYNKPCDNPNVLIMSDMIGMPDAYKVQLKQGEMTDDKDIQSMCYIPHPSEPIYWVLSETGGMGYVHKDGDAGLAKKQSESEGQKSN